MNTFNSNDYALGKEYQNQMQAKAQRIQQADALPSQALDKGNLFVHLSHKPVVIAISVGLFFAGFIL